MARQRSDLEIEVDDAMRGWVAINREENPMEWQAWIKWRGENMRSFIEPNNLTVPTEFPPLTVAAAKDWETPSSRKSLKSSVKQSCSEKG